ncbi:hypothetical protein, partial [Xanthomonas hortorum]|uniref:hypothetical protein n=1 Tax=Xanthomonas hortorum TaxID=56454 RepID=UPI001F41E992
AFGFAQKADDLLVSKTFLHVQSPRGRELDSKLRRYSKLGGRRIYKTLGVSARSFSVSMLRRLNQDFGEPPRNGALLAKPRHGKIAFKKTDSPPRVTCIVNA